MIDVIFLCGEDLIFSNTMCVLPNISDKIKLRNIWYRVIAKEWNISLCSFVAIFLETI